ncbi:MAG TPA: hypothetical protein VH601_03380 [Bryobacteraceae bacterium]|jgi:hypothetical protein
MKKFLPCLLLIAGAGVTRASIVESISFDLSDLHPGSALSGTFTLPDSPVPGDTAPVLLSFSDPQNYSPSSVSSTITIGNGTFLAFTVGFSDIVFTNPSGNMFTKNNNLMPRGMAQCASFPCMATGGFQDNDPPAFTSTYTITPASVPEPAYSLLLPALLAGFILGRRAVAAK